MQAETRSASASDPVTLALAGGTGLAGTLTVSPHNGIATFSNLSVSTAGTGLTLLATGPQLSFVNSATFTISRRAAALLRRR